MEALGDSALRSRILDIDAGRGGQDRQRLEALKKADLEEPCDDLGRRKEKQNVMAVQTDATKQKSDKVRELEKALQQNKRKLEVYEREESLRQRLSS